MRRIEHMAVCPSLDVTMWKLLSRAAREVWNVLCFIGFLAKGLFGVLRLVWLALCHPLRTLGLAILGYVLIMTVLSTVLPPG
ncbi:hypothetical protein PAQ31011_05133 [Pandoraea aquatica]|uniref:Uncharacterized protein n=1 Tax=Pandoraea aquatica TaxID=2508290 RepID=A0A5E4Z6F4_9BURK|nr:hypothetical protein [Pandoraea aquatica]VVE56706.1 hypothetical protein PAQ31011_05133 [Pandoraea aquatica]